MPSPLVSVITPTFDRPAFLPRTYAQVQAQTVAPLEWVVVDDSEQPSEFMAALADPRVRYIHLPERTPLGEKRNIAVGQSAGQIVAQFDDDDHYAPHYLQTMTSHLGDGGADVVKLAGFFLYSKVQRRFGYWDQTDKTAPQFVWSSSRNVELVKMPAGGERDQVHLSYGFSYVFKKAVWEAERFPARAWGEDTPFIKAAIANGFKVSLLNDQVGLCLHVVHEGNASKSFPQYILPHWLLGQFFPGVDPARL